MSDVASKLLEQLLTLPEEDRAFVADRLRDSLSEDDDAYPEELKDPEFLAELNRRLDSVANGTADLMPVDEAVAEMRVELARRRASRAGGSS